MLGLLIVDEIGYRRSVATRRTCSSMSSKCCARGSMIPTSNLPFKQWPTALADDQALTAELLNRLPHHAHIVQNDVESYRPKEKRKTGSIKTATKAR